jgi:hypothetical protein
MTTERALGPRLRRLGHFGVGAFSAVCAAFIPRLAATLPTSSESGFLTVKVFTSEYLFSMLIFPSSSEAWSSSSNGRPRETLAKCLCRRSRFPHSSRASSIRPRSRIK